ncbi:MAG: 4'-phosphopantetheinyl transferase superfamily protein [Spirochaetes bacterium]|nr:4'-phosphopantetheinyl transferase superfamily protein [Spirochaetota bacterium]
MNIFKKAKKELETKRIFFIHTSKRHSIDSLLPEEKSVIAKAVKKRQMDFASGRWCAYQILDMMGRSDRPILTGEGGEPLWPAGICGSISHTDSLACAIGALENNYTSVGLDIEKRTRPISQRALKIILNDDEELWLEQHRGRDLEKIIFSAKESIFKLLYPLTGKRFYFSYVSIISVDDKYFTARLNKDLDDTFKKGNEFKGIYFSDNEYILAISFLK